MGKNSRICSPTEEKEQSVGTRGLFCPPAEGSATVIPCLTDKPIFLIVGRLIKDAHTIVFMPSDLKLLIRIDLGIQSVRLLDDTDLWDPV